MNLRQLHDKRDDLVFSSFHIPNLDSIKCLLSIYGLVADHGDDNELFLHDG